MSNIKLKDHNWAAEGIYDTNQSKSQQTINSDVNTKIGQATLQTSSKNLSGATNELKGRADTLDSKYDNVVTVANTQPSSEYNKVWLPLTVSEGTQVPTWAEHQALESSLNDAIISLRGNIKMNTSWKNVSGSYGTLQAYYYESSTATTDYDLPENFVYVLCMQYKSTRGTAIAIRWQSGAYRMWINTLHGDTWSGWKQTTPYTSIDRFTLTADCWGVWNPASTTLASYTIPETGFYDIWFCPTVNIKNNNATRLRLYANSTIVAFGQVSSPTEARLPLALRYMGQLTAGTVITLQCQCDGSLSDLRMLFASSETQSSILMNHFVHRIY